MSLVWKESLLILRDSGRAGGEQGWSLGQEWCLLHSCLSGLACCSKNAISSSGPSLLPLQPGCLQSHPREGVPRWGSSEDTQVKGRQEMGWLGEEALTAFSGCNLSHLPSCSEDISHVDPPKDVTETTQETFKRGEQIIYPRENIHSCYMEEGTALQAKKEVQTKAPLHADSTRKQF